VLEQERLKHEQRYNAKVEEMTALQTLVDELNGKVANLTNVVKGLEDDKSDLERELNLQNKEIMRM
jgi:FtsZ-binding cell division protein ZapB